MRSDRLLQLCMRGLVLLNLVFVALTEAAGLHWLAPLFALTLAAPLLAPLRERATYRWTWNLAVVAFFAFLLQSALHARLGRVLEGGLVLAVLCQVHLLNNLRDEQRPDLLFVNAFVIAVMAGYMSPDLGFSVAFLAFAPCFVVGLQLLTATRDGRVLAPATTRAFVRDGLARAGALLAASFLVFVVWPRDFERKAFFHGRLGPGSKLELGFADDLRLDRRGRAEASDAPALTVHVLDDAVQLAAGDLPALWRGAVLAEARAGGAWAELTEAPVVDGGSAWEKGYGGLVRPYASEGPRVRVEVLRHAQGTRALFAPESARAVRVRRERGDDPTRLRAHPDGTLEVGSQDDVQYELSLSLAEPARAARRPATWPRTFAPYLALPDGPDVRRARDLARRLAAQLPPDVGQAQLVAHLTDHLSDTFPYVAPGGEGAARSLDAFLAGDGGGHCEFFASALATMLRSLDVPCRVATGFRSRRWDPATRTLEVRRRDAHAWVEVFDPEAGWIAADPSPVGLEHEVRETWWSRLRTKARAGWSAITGFDDDARAALFAWLAAAPGRALGAVRARPLIALAIASAVAALAALLARARRRRTPAAVRAYRHALRRARLESRPGETPRELLARAQTTGCPPDRLDALARATAAHEAARYAA